MVNVGTGQGVTVRELLAIFEDVFGRPVPTVEAPAEARLRRWRVRQRRQGARRARLVRRFDGGRRGRLPAPLPPGGICRRRREILGFLQLTPANLHSEGEPAHPRTPRSPTGDWQSTLRSKGYRLTPQRELVLRAVERLGHATPDEVLTAVREESQAVNVSTVYRALELLEASSWSGTRTSPTGRRPTTPQRRRPTSTWSAATATRSPRSRPRTSPR